jgi:chromosome segregation ATPase
MEPQPLCVECPAEAVARLVVGSLGIQDALCSEHLQPRTRAYELALTPFHLVSLVRLPDRIEDAYAEVVHDLRSSERATSESLGALDAATAKVARLELDCERLARRVTEEKLKVLERLESEERLTAELAAEREKTERLSTELAEALGRADEHQELAVTLEAQLTALERLTGIARGSERESTAGGSPAAGERAAVVEGAEPGSEAPATGR